MLRETILWEAMSDGKLPQRFVGWNGLISVIREGNNFEESAYLDKGDIILDCKGVLGGTIVTTEVIFIAERPKGPARS